MVTLPMTLSDPERPKLPQFVHLASPFIALQRVNLETSIFLTLIYHSKSHPADEKSSLKGAWSGSHEQFLHCGLGKFHHSKSSVDK